MSVLVSDRTESKFEAITYSIELHDMLIDLMQRSFGVKDLDQLVRVRYAHGKDATEDFSRYIFSIQDDLMNRTLQNGPTQEFTLFERGRVRPITSIQIRDRIIRHVLCDEVLLPEVKKHIIYDNCASIKGRGISHQRDRFEVHLRKYYRLYGNEGWILFGDFSKFYDNIIHEIAKRELLKLFDDDEFIDWLLTQIF